MSNSKTSVWTRLGYRIIYGGCWLTGLLPGWFLYRVLANMVYFLLRRVVRYRLRVVRENLAGAFPEKSVAELRTVERGFYHNLAEYFVDAIDLASITPRELLRRAHFADDVRDKCFRIIGERNWVEMIGHFGSWELMTSYASCPSTPAVVAVYRPLRNKAFDMYYNKIRSRLGMIYPVPMNDVLRFCITHRDGIDGHVLNIGLVSDQSPPVDAQSKWIPFLNRPTVFFRGGERIARKFGWPVYYLRVRKTGPGHYEQSLEQIWDGVSPTEDHAITETFVRMLEEDIRRSPEMWLWSHRRWRRQPHGEAARTYNETYGTSIPE